MVFCAIKLYNMLRRWLFLLVSVPSRRVHVRLVPSGFYPGTVTKHHLINYLILIILIHNLLPLQHVGRDHTPIAPPLKTSAWCCTVGLHPRPSSSAKVRRRSPPCVARGRKISRRNWMPSKSWKLLVNHDL